MPAPTTAESPAHRRWRHAVEGFLRPRAPCETPRPCCGPDTSCGRLGEGNPRRCAVGGCAGPSTVVEMARPAAVSFAPTRAPYSRGGVPAPSRTMRNAPPMLRARYVVEGWGEGNPRRCAVGQAAPGLRDGCGNGEARGGFLRPYTCPLQRLERCLNLPLCAGDSGAWASSSCLSCASRSSSSCSVRAYRARSWPSSPPSRSDARFPG